MKNQEEHTRKKPKKYDLSKWAALHPIGSACKLELDSGKFVDSRIRSEPWLLGSGHAVVKIEDYAGGYMLERISP